AARKDPRWVRTAAPSEFPCNHRTCNLSIYLTAVEPVNGATRINHSGFEVSCGGAMRAVLQRVREAAVTVDGVEIARIGKGLLALVAVSREDSRRDLEWMAKKIVELRIFDDEQGKLNLSLMETSGELLIVSQFTLYGDCRKGRRPSYIEAAPPAE